VSDEVTALDPHAPVHGSTVGPWLILERMDSGSFGIVYKARRAGHPDSPPVAVKMARQPKDPRYKREAELLVEGFTLYDWFQGGRTSREVLPHPSDYATLSRDLEALLLRLLSNERQQRGTAEALAREAAALAEAAGEAADRPILPAESARRTGSGGPSSLGSGLGAAFVAVLVLLLVRPEPPREEPQASRWQDAPSRFAPDAGVSEEALSSVQGMPSTPVAAQSLARPMPAQAFPGQTKEATV
jgi:hypothetical protein